MSFPDPYPPPFMPRPFIDGDVGGGGWPVHPLDHSGFPVNHQERPDPIMYSEQAAPLKRPRDSENNSPSYGQFIRPTNPRMNPPSNPGGGKGTSHLFYKTRMCAKFLDGSCKNGANCTFAHGIEDMREPPPNWQELVREKDGGIKSWNDDQRLIHKMKLCRKFYNGEECPYGQNCNFLHERPDSNYSAVSVDEWPGSRTDMPMQRESAAISIGTRGSAIGGNASDYDRPEVIKPINPNSDGLRTKAVYWKTKLCSKWEITGQCPFGERCNFAHGQSELHVPSAQVDADFRVNSSTIQIKPVTAPVTDLSPANVEVVAQVRDKREDKNFSMWEPKKKINKIYGDWIDDLTPRHGSPNEVEDW